MKDLNKIAYCGLYCGACKIYISNQNNTLEIISEETKIPVDYLKCEGCRSNETSLYCSNCTMKKCCIKKGIFTCADCHEFPCSVLQAFETDQHLHHKGVIYSLEMLKEKGKTVWLEVQIDRWTCKGCNTPFDWYKTKCNSCNETVDGLIILNN